MTFASNNKEVCALLFYENRLGIKKSVISLFTCFVRTSTRNSVNPIVQIP